MSSNRKNKAIYAKRYTFSDVDVYALTQFSGILPAWEIASRMGISEAKVTHKMTRLGLTIAGGEIPKHKKIPYWFYKNNDGKIVPYYEPTPLDLAKAGNVSYLFYRKTDD